MVFKTIWIITLLAILLCDLASAQTFPEFKKQIQSEENNIKRIRLLKKATSSLGQYSLSQQAEYWFLLGKGLNKQHQMVAAYNAFTKAINIYIKQDLPPSSLIVNLLIERARVVANIDHYNTSSCKDREQALYLARELSQLSLIAKSIAYYAKCLQSEEHGISKSLQLFEEAFNIAKTEQLNFAIKQIIFNQAASLYFRALIYDKAYEYNKLAYDSFIATKDVNGVYHSILNAVHYSIALVDIALAWQHLNELERFAKQNPEFNDAKLKFYYLSAKAAQLEKNWPLSISFLKAAMKESQNSQNISYTQATYELLSISYFRVGEIKNSYQILSALEKIYPNKKPIKKEVLLIKALMTNKPVEIVKSALKLIDKEKQSKNNFVKQSTTQSAQLFDDKLKQLDNIILEQQLTIIMISTFFIVASLVGFSYLQIQRKKLALKKNQLTDELLNKKNQLLADVSHELSTPLTVLKLQVESLKDGLENDVQVTYDALDNKLDEVQHLIDDIHQLAQSDVGALQLNIESFELNETLNTWQSELSNFVNRSKLSFEIERNLPEKLLVNFDRDRIKQVFTNLLSNSVKYTSKPGKIKLTANLKGQTLLLSMEDSKPGVSEDDLSEIFERLYRIESSRSRETGGSGLGLAICKSLIEAHNGRIYAQHSSLGGIKIIIELPLFSQ